VKKHGLKSFSNMEYGHKYKKYQNTTPHTQRPFRSEPGFEQFIILVGRKVELFNVCHDLNLITITIRKHLAEGREVRQKLKTHTHTHTKDLSHSSTTDMLLIHTDSNVLQV
jgi:hypothetical protein